MTQEEKTCPLYVYTHLSIDTKQLSKYRLRSTEFFWIDGEKALGELKKKRSSKLMILLLSLTLTKRSRHLHDAKNQHQVGESILSIGLYPSLIHSASGVQHRDCVNLLNGSPQKVFVVHMPRVSGSNPSELLLLSFVQLNTQSYSSHAELHRAIS